MLNVASPKPEYFSAILAGSKRLKDSGWERFTPYTRSEWPLSVISSQQVSSLQTISVWSTDAETTRSRFAIAATPRT